jgi:hypothetical protein
MMMEIMHGLQHGQRSPVQAPGILRHIQSQWAAFRKDDRLAESKMNNSAGYHVDLEI